MRKTKREMKKMRMSNEMHLHGRLYCANKP